MRHNFPANCTAQSEMMQMCLAIANEEADWRKYNIINS